MSREQDQARLLAERIARRISESSNKNAAPENSESAADVSHELSAMHASLNELQKRLAHIESHLTHGADKSSAEAQGVPDHKRAAARGGDTPSQTRATHSPWLSGMYVPATHPSQERFGINEAVVSELVDFFESEKTCQLEPGGKPCDHCAMCSSRGF